MNKFSSGEAIKFGWNVFKGNMGLLISVEIATILVGLVSSLINTFALPEGTAIAFLVSIGLSVLGVIVGMGGVRIFIDLVDGKKPTIGMLFSETKHLLSYIIASILFSIIVGIGSLLLIIPGIVWSIKYSLWPYFIIDKGMGPIEALKASGRATYGHKWNLLVFGFMLLLLNILGILLLGVGLLATASVSALSFMYIYRKLESSSAVNTVTASS